MQAKEDINAILGKRFPELDLSSRSPSLRTINGCGFTLFGAREHDRETNSYVATQYLTILFIPLIPISAYRVIPAKDGGWFILGKVPLNRADIAPKRMLAGLAIGLVSITIGLGIIFGLAFLIDYLQGR